MPLSEIINYLVHTVHNEFIAIGALNTETYCFCCFCRHLCSVSTSLDVLQKLDLIRDELLDIYSTRSKKNMGHCKTSFEIVLFWPQQT